MRPRLLVVLCSLACASAYLSAQAVDPEKSLTQYIKTAWSADAGIKEALDLIQDNQGYIWIGTYDGPVRFDGISFVIPTDIRGTPAPGSARAFCLDSEGSLWIGSNNQGLVRYRRQRYDYFDMSQGLPNNSVRRLLHDSKGRIWVGTVAGLAVLESETIRTFSNEPELQTAQIMFLQEDAFGRIWVGTNGTNGLYVIEGDKVRPENSLLPATEGRQRTVNLLFAGPDTWVATERNLYRLRQSALVESWQLSDFLPANSRFAPSTLYLSGDGTLWLYGDGGMLRLHRGAGSFFDTRQGLSDSLVTSLLSDREGNLWVGSGRGLDKFSGSKFAVYGISEGLTDPGVNTVLAKSDGSIWLGTNNGVGVLAAGATGIRMLSDMPELFGRIRHMIEDRHGVVWLSVYGNGLYGIENGKLRYIFKETDGLVGNRVRTIMESSDGSLYVGTTTGLSIISADRKSIQNHTPATGMGFLYVMCVYEDSAGRIWLGSDGQGIQLYENGRFGPVLNQQGGLAGDVVFRFLQLEPAGDMFVTTAGGISRIGKDRLFSYTTAQGLPVDAVFEIVPDREGNLWLTTTSAIIRVSRQDMDAVAAGQLSQLACQLFDKGSGLRELPMSTAFSAVDSLGTIWFPTLSGAARIDPLNIPGNQVPPPVIIIDSVFIDGTEFERSQKSVIRPQDKKIDLAFTALSFVAPEKVLLQYMLEGFDNDWSPLGKKREATYTNLDPGKYRFLVRAVNNDGVYSENAVSFSFSKQAWWHQTWYFRLLASLFLLAVFSSLAYLLHLDRTRRYREKLAQQEKELALERKALEFERKAKEIETELKLSYSRFVPQEFISILKRTSILEVQLGDQVQRHMSVLFADIRSFAGISEAMTPAESFAFLNTYLQAIEPGLKRNGGFVDKYVGDAIMALFPESIVSAVMAGVELQASLRSLNARKASESWPELKVGIGLHVGLLMLGAIGADRRMDVTVISDAVNIASRLEQLNKYYGSSLIVSEEVAADPEVRAAFTLRPLDRVRLYGRQRPLLVYDVLEAEAAEEADCRRANLADYLAAREALHAAAYEQAASAFAELKKRCPADPVMDRQLQKASMCLAEGTGSWDGVVDFGKR